MDNRTPPLSREPLHFISPAVNAHTLPNGTRIRLIPAPAEDLVTITIGIEYGAIHEVIEGETTFTAKMLARGTQQRTSNEFADAVESRGCVVTAGAGYDATTLSGVGLAKHTDALLELLGECLHSPRFDPDDIDLERERRITEQSMNADDPEMLAVWASMAVSYHDHPYGRSRDGNAETLQVVDASVIRGVHARMLQAPRAAVVSGPFDAAVMLERLAHILSPLPVAFVADDFAEAQALSSTAALAIKDDAVQSVIRIALPAVGYNHPDLAALSLATSALGGFPLARLFTILREQKGYTYGAYAYPDLRKHGRSTVIGTSVGNAYCRDTMLTIHSELQKISQQELLPDELEHARQYMLGAFARSTETPDQAASLVWTTLHHDLAADHFEKYVAQLQACTIDDCLQAQQTYLRPETWTMGLAGPTDIVTDAVQGLVQRIVHYDPDSRRLVEA